MKVQMGPYPKKGFGDRKISVHIDKYDVWSMDNTLAHIILPMLKQLRKTKHGAPNTDNEGVPARLRDKRKDKNHWETDNNHFKRWDWILDEMIWAFEQKLTDWEHKYHSGKADILWQALDEDDKPIGKPKKLGAKKTEEEKDAKFFRLVNGPKHTLKVDQKGMAKHQARISNGFRLFGKYYENLWD